MAARATQSRSTTSVGMRRTNRLVRWVPESGAKRSKFNVTTRTLDEKYGERFHLDWVTCAARLSAAKCATIIKLGRSFATEVPRVVGENILSAHRVGNVHLLPAIPETAPVYNLLWDVAADAAARQFGLAITAITRMPQYVEYVAGYGHFHWHNDYSHESVEAPRKLTVIVQLSESDEYQGGDLEIFGNGPVAVPRDRGTMICFPSFVVHRVTPVTAGIRRVVVAWVAGPRLA